MRTKFAKYHGIGNDFLVVDLREAADDAAASMQDPSVVSALCDRGFGVGADGVLALLAPTSPEAIARMRVLNADGSEAEMCGNGIRCVAKFLGEQANFSGDAVVIDTGAGPLRCQLHRDNSGAVSSVTVDMGKPRVLRGEIPMTGPASERCLLQPLELPGQVTRLFTAVSMGNPHAITFVEDATDLRELAVGVGPSVEQSEWFPRGTNVEYARLKSRREIDVVVWERGSGLTLACGTGACATVVAACLTDRVNVGDEVTVNLPGGSLAITVAADYATVLMRGPAAFVFDGELEPRAVAARPTL